MVRNEEIRTFAEDVAGILEDMLEGGQVTVNDVKKNNDIILTGIVITGNGSNVSPTIYMEDIYNDCKGDVEEAARRVLNTYNKYKIDGEFDVNFITDYSKASLRLRAKLINRNFNNDYLKNIPYKEYAEDLALIAYIEVDSDMLNGNASVTVNDSILSAWNIDFSEVISKALDNTVATIQIKGMIETMLGMGIDNPSMLGLDEEDEKMYVLSNEKKYYGAVGIVNEEILKDFCKKKNFDSLIIIPSSIHECLLIPSDAMPIDDVNAMINEINSTQVADGEILSDHAYFYRVGSGISCKAA